MLEAKYSRKDDTENQFSTGLVPGAKAWPAPYCPNPISAVIDLPGSKSLIARELVLSALAESESKIVRPLRSRDSELMVEALRALGAKIDWNEDEIIVHPAAELTGSTSIACGLAGTVMRFVPALAALALGPTSFDGDEYARKRPMKELIEALRTLGADIADDGLGALPFTVHGSGSLRGGLVELDASNSSQFVSALLLAGSRFKEGVKIRHTGEKLPSIPHIEMTIDALEKRGVNVQKNGSNEWIVTPAEISGRTLVLEPDLSNAAPFLAAALATRGSVSIPGWPTTTTQVGDKLRELLPMFGASVNLVNDTLTVTGGKEIQAVEMHIPDAGELAPTMVGLAALANGVSTITGIGHIRHHETDRIKALKTELEAIGCTVDELPDGVRVTPPEKYLASAWNSYADHRMATTGALIALRVPGIEIIDIESTSKTMPEFTAMWNNLVESQTA